MRFGCNCPDYLNREDFNLYKYAQKKTYPYTGTQDLKPGTYDAGTNTLTVNDLSTLVTFQVLQGTLVLYTRRVFLRSCRWYGLQSLFLFRSKSAFLSAQVLQTHLRFLVGYAESIPELQIPRRLSSATH